MSEQDRPISEGARSFDAVRPLDFHDLMHFRVMNIQLVCSPYDLFLLEEAGNLGERMLGEYRNLDLHYSPGLSGVSRGEVALERLRSRQCDLVISTPHVGDMNAVELTRRIHEQSPGLPVAVLGYNVRELEELSARHDTSCLAGRFLWQGDARILLAIIKVVEDAINAPHDTRSVGVQVILLVEDSVRHYSSFLPVIYSELFQQSRRVISEGANQEMKVTRMRARPKILLCRTFEEAETAFAAYEEHVLGVISDIELPRGGALDGAAGLSLVELVRARQADVPIILQSAQAENRVQAESAGAAFLLKGSPVLLTDLRRLLLRDFGFGDFVFKLPDGTTVANAADLLDLERKLHEVPAESVVYHASRNHFSRWLKARSDFELARELRPRRRGPGADPEDVRRSLVQSISRYREGRSQEVVADFDAHALDEGINFLKIGSGSLGGKARGLAFARLLMGRRRLRNRYPGVRVWVPPTVVVATDVFDELLELNQLKEAALSGSDEADLLELFDAAVFPRQARADLAAFLSVAHYPLAVRSSSILEDSHDELLAGIYDTYMLPNLDLDPEVRLQQLLHAIKRVYASTFSRRAQERLEGSPHRLEEEKMAVLVQRIVGSDHGGRFYPTLAGVARSTDGLTAARNRCAGGVVAVRLGLGPVDLNDESGVRLERSMDAAPMRFEAVAAALTQKQRQLSALHLSAAADSHGPATMAETCFGIDVARSDGTLDLLAAASDFPLCEILDELMTAGHHGVGTPVELEFAVDLSQPPPDEARWFALLQIRPVRRS